MKSEEIIKILKDEQNNIDFEWLKEEAQPMVDAYSEAIKAVDVVDKIKKACYSNESDFIDTVLDILCESYGTEEDRESWLKEAEND